MTHESHNVRANSSRLAVCIALLFVTSLSINLLSAFIRHHEAGLGCADVIECYGDIGAIESPPSQVEAATRALTPATAVKQTHRALAALLVVLVLTVVYLARQPASILGAAQYVPHAMVAVVLLLAVIGPASYRKSLPAVAAFNLLGGVLLLAICYWLWMVVRALPQSLSLGRMRWWVLVVVSMQIALGAWVSANFAGTACTGVLCSDPLPGRDGGVLASFWIWRELTIESGRVVMTDAQRFIQMAHRFGAIVSVLAVGWMAVRVWAARHTNLSLLLIGLTVAQVTLGVVAAGAGLSLGLVLAHNLVASFLLLTVLRIVYISREPPAKALTT